MAVDHPDRAADAAASHPPALAHDGRARGDGLRLARLHQNVAALGVRARDLVLSSLAPARRRRLLASLEAGLEQDGGPHRRDFQPAGAGFFALGFRFFPQVIQPITA